MNGLCRGREVCTWRLIPGCARAFSEMHAGVPSISRSASLGFRLVRPPLARALVLSGLAWPCRSRGRGGAKGPERQFFERTSPPTRSRTGWPGILCVRCLSGVAPNGTVPDRSQLPWQLAQPAGAPCPFSTRAPTGRLEIEARAAALPAPLSSNVPRRASAGPDFFPASVPQPPAPGGGGAAYGPPSPCLPRRLGESLCGAFTFGRGRAHCALQRPRTTPVRKARPPGASEPVQLP